MKRYLVVLIVIGSLFSVLCAERPFHVEDTSLLGKGAEVELGYSGSTAGKSKRTVKSLIARYALSPDVELEYSRAFIDAPRHPFGNADTNMGMKFAIDKKQAVKAAFSFIDGDEINGFGNEYTAYSLTYAYEGMVKTATYYANVGYHTYNPGPWYSDEEIVQNHFLLGLGLRFPIPTVEKLAVYAEAMKPIVLGYYKDNMDGYVQGMLGISYVWNDIPLDLSFTSQAESPQFTYALGVTFAFKSVDIQVPTIDFL